MSEPDEPHRRRLDDGPFASMELILYQIGELKADVKAGFERMDGRFDRAESRLTSLERFRERQEERDRADAATSNVVTARWVPILLSMFAVSTTVILFVIGAK